MAEDFLYLLEQQSLYRFTGRINLLWGSMRKMEGYLLMKEGNPQFFLFQQDKGIRGLLKFLLQGDSLKDFSFVMEPEIFNEKIKNIEESLKEIKDLFTQAQIQHLQYKAERPPDHLFLKIKPAFVSGKEEILPPEFDLLCILSDSSMVKEIYQQSPYFEFEVTKTLISLRKKGALVVLQQEKS